VQSCVCLHLFVLGARFAVEPTLIGLLELSVLHCFRALGGALLQCVHALEGLLGDVLIWFVAVFVFVVCVCLCVLSSVAGCFAISVCFVVSFLPVYVCCVCGCFVVCVCPGVVSLCLFCGYRVCFAPLCMQTRGTI
jgi:hypothetical protein